MRILHILDHSLPLQSGYTFRTAAILREQRALGWETVQMTTPRHALDAGRDARDSEQASGWLFYRTPGFEPRWGRVPGAAYVEEMAATERRLQVLVDKHQPDVLHAHSPVLNAMPAFRVGSRSHIPVVYELRALWEDAAVDHGSTREGSVRYRLSRFLESQALRRADHVTTICEGLKREIVSRGIPAHKVTVIPNAVDAAQFRVGSVPDEALRGKLGLQGATVLGFAGSFYGYEGLDLLIEAYALLANSHPQLRVLLLGGGPQDEALRQLARDRKLEDRIVFTGRIPHEEVQRYYDLIDVLVYPRRRMRLTEIVTPLKPLEAMAQGRMLIASDVGGHRELIRDLDTGFLFPAGDVAALARTIETVLAQPGSWPAFRQRARKHIESERTWAQSVGRYADVYERLLAHSVPAPAHLKTGT